VTVLGAGRRLGLWFQGCSLACAGCMAHDTWPATGGREVTVSALAALWRDAVADGADGLTISGGEPFQQVEALAALLAAVDAERVTATAPGGPAEGRDLDILVYTGYEWAELDAERRAVAARADVLVTGRFRVGEPTALVWRGSANQEMRPLSPLGHRRYGPHRTREASAAVQADVEPDGTVRIIGIPRAGTIHRMESALRASGVTLAGPSWRPEAERE